MLSEHWPDSRDDDFSGSRFRLSLKSQGKMSIQSNTSNPSLGVVNFVPADGPTFGNAIIAHRDLAGISFTGSSPTFRTLWKGVGENIENYNMS